MNQRGTADGFLHTQFAALHASRQVHFAFPCEQRDGAHFAQVNANRIVRVNGLFHLLLGVEEVLFCFGVEKFRFFVEVDGQGSFG